MAGEARQEDKSKRAVCLKSENFTDMQQWKIEPVVIKEMKLENSIHDPMQEEPTVDELSVYIPN